MNTISHSDIQQLIALPKTPRVSIYLSTKPASAGAQYNQLRIKAQLEAAENLLQCRGLCQPDIRQLLQPTRELLKSPVSWQAGNAGLAVLISREGFHVWHLPYECEDLCIVGDTFHVVPLLSWFNEDAPYYLLAASQNGVRLLSGKRDNLVELHVPNLPAGGKEVLNYDPREGAYQTHSGHPELRGKEGVVFTGQGGKVDVEKEEIAAYFRLVDAAVSKYLRNRTEPLVFVGVDYLYTIYQHHNHYPHLLSKHIAGNPSMFSAEELRARAWPIIAALLCDRQETLIARYWELIGRGRSCTRIEEILNAADAGTVEALFVSSTIRRWGKYDSRTQKARLDEHCQNDSEDLVNLAVCLALKHAGKVECVMRGNIPGGGAMASILRYTPAAVFA